MGAGAVPVRLGLTWLAAALGVGFLVLQAVVWRQMLLAGIAADIARDSDCAVRKGETTLQEINRVTFVS